MSAMNSLNDATDWARGDGLEILLLGVGTILLTRVITWSGTRITRRIDARDQDTDAFIRSEAAKHRHSVTQVITWAAVVLTYCIAAGLVLERLAVPVTSLIAPATVAGVALGFGAQRIVQDILAGFFIITERQYGFGDLIRISDLGATIGITGTVEDITLRITRMRTANGEVVIIPNGQITQITNLSQDWARAVVDVPLPATADVTRVSALLRDIGTELYASAAFRPVLLDAPTVMGVESIGVGTFSIRMVARTLPGQQFIIGRELRTRITAGLGDEGIALAADAPATGVVPPR